jgi:hypothetical protein
MMLDEVGRIGRPFRSCSRESRERGVLRLLRGLVLCAAAM